MSLVLIAVCLPVYTGGLLMVARARWHHRCAECAYRLRPATGRHRLRPVPPALPASPQVVNVDDEQTARIPRPWPRPALPGGPSYVPPGPVSDVP